jgi:hypothetical protein
LPTLADLAGIRVASDKPLDGKSLAPLLLQTGANWPDRMLFSHWNGRVSVRTQQHRLDPTGKLFDMLADPAQRSDVSQSQPEVAARLSQAVEAWKADVLADYQRVRQPFTVGYPEFPTTDLPARDGVPHGGVERSARAPNCSYFRNWTSTDDRITWDIEIHTAGRYEAVVYYACPAADLGSTIELRLEGSGNIQSTLTRANDPPPRGAEHDRVRREGESYMKDFQPHRLGVIELKSGRGELSLRALSIPGRQAMEVESVSLTLLK